MLVDKVVFVTGATSGIGRSCAEVFSAAGARVLLCGRRADRLDELVAALPGPAYAAPLDVRDRGATLEWVAALPAEWSAIDVLINNAGLAAGRAPLHEDDPDNWDRMLDTNVRGLLNVSHALLPGMIARGQGHVVNVGSIAGRDPYPGGAVYCATKAAVDSLSNALRADLLGTGVKVSVVAPGLVETEFSLVRFGGDRDRAAQVYEGVDPLTPDDIAEAVAWIVDRPAHVQVSDMVLLAANQAGATRIHRH